MGTPSGAGQELEVSLKEIEAEHFTSPDTREAKWPYAIGPSVVQADSPVIPSDRGLLVQRPGKKRDRTR
eukprot:7027233-Heterocapsa_arctica.AAC.1